MAFIEKIARKVTVLHEGAVLAEGPLDAGAERPAGDRGLPGALTRCSSVDGPQPVLRRQPHPARPRVRGAGGQGDRAARPQRRRQDHAAATLMGLVPARDRQGRVRRPRPHRARRPYERARAGIGYVPQGREIFPRLTVEENLEMGLATRPRGARHPGAHLRACSRCCGRCCAGAAATSPAASSSSSRSAARSRWARSCSSSTSRPRASSPRSSRTSSARSARSPRPARWRSCWSSSTTTSRARSPTSTW